MSQYGTPFNSYPAAKTPLTGNEVLLIAQQSASGNYINSVTVRVTDLFTGISGLHTSGTTTPSDYLLVLQGSTGSGTGTLALVNPDELLPSIGIPDSPLLGGNGEAFTSVAPGTALTIDGSGNLNVQAATDSIIGGVKPDGVTLQVDGSGVISGKTNVANGLVGLDSTNHIPVAQIPAATGSALGGVKPDGVTLQVDGTGTLSGKTNVANGLAGLDATNHVPAAQIPLATGTVIGGVKPDGQTLQVDGSGTLSVKGPLGVSAGGTGATTLAAHGVLVGNGTSAISVTAAGTAGQVLTSNGASADPTFQTVSGRLIGVQVFSSAGTSTYTPTPGTNSIVVEGIGGGGGGAGVAAASAGQVALGSGGNAGSYGKTRLTSGFSGASFTVGSGGAGGAAGANNGTAGTATTFGTFTCPGGPGGISSAATVPPFVGTSAAGTAANGSIVSGVGASGGAAIALGTTAFMSGAGASSLWGSGGVPVTISGPGNSALGRGAGGSGAASGPSGAAAAGGNGSDGYLIVWEYS